MTTPATPPTLIGLICDGIDRGDSGPQIAVDVRAAGYTRTPPPKPLEQLFAAPDGEDEPTLWTRDTPPLPMLRRTDLGRHHRTINGQQVTDAWDAIVALAGPAPTNQEPTP